MIRGTSLNGIIHREHFRSHGDLRVWVQARNQHGSAKSQEDVFNTADISESVLYVLYDYRHQHK